MFPAAGQGLPRSGSIPKAAGSSGPPQLPRRFSSLSYLGYLMKRGITVDDFDDIVEVHPSTDGIYPLARYAAGVLKKKE